MTVLKIDLDIDNKYECVNHLIERLRFLNNIGIFPVLYITKIELLKKKSYSCKIYTDKVLKDDYLIILLQSIIGEDWRCTSIKLRDYLLKINNYNRLFDIKRYPNGEYKEAKIINITKEVLKAFEISN